MNLGIVRRRLAGLRFDIDLGLKGKERIGGEDMKFVYVYSLLARGDRGYWVPDAEIVHPFPFDRLKFAPMLRQYLGVEHWRIPEGGEVSHGCEAEILHQLCEQLVPDRCSDSLSGGEDSKADTKNQ